MSASAEASARGAGAPSEIESYFRGAIRVDARDARSLFARLVVPADLQGPRDVTHGGAVTTLLAELARLQAARPPRADLAAAPFVIDAAFERELRVGTEVVGRADVAGQDEIACRVERPDGTLIAKARVGPARAADLDALAEPPRAGRVAELLARASAGALAGERGERAGAGGGAGAAPPPAREADEVPGTAMCLACGVENSRGLRFRYRATDDLVWKHLAPPPHFRAPAGAAYHGAAAIALDEIGWWLGALAFGGCGVSTRLRLVCDPRALDDAPLLVAGDRRDADPADAKARFWTSRARIWSAAGRPAAAATVLFAGSHAYTRAMLADLAGASDAATIQRVFPRLPTDQIS